MKRISARCAAVCSLLALLLAAGPARAQQPSLPAEIDRSYDLNFASKHIAEQNFQTGLDLMLRPVKTSNVSLFVGIDLRAAQIDVTLHDVRGHVQFHASTEQITNVLRAHSQR